MGSQGWVERTENGTYERRNGNQGNQGNQGDDITTEIYNREFCDGALSDLVVSVANAINRVLLYDIDADLEDPEIDPTLTIQSPYPYVDIASSSSSNSRGHSSFSPLSQGLDARQSESKRQSESQRDARLACVDCLESLAQVGFCYVLFCSALLVSHSAAVIITLYPTTVPPIHKCTSADVLKRS